VLLFLGVSALVIVTPGQDTALTIRNTLLGGQPHGVATAFGISAGQAVWTATAALGVGAVVAASEPVFLALRLAGAAYLVWLGTRTLWDAARRTRTRIDSRRPARRPRGAFRQGVLSNLGNPKMLAFFTSLLPQFSASAAGLLAHGLLFCALTCAWLTLYAVVVARTRVLLARGRVRRAIDTLTGLVLVSFGLRVAAERG
jgi:threonine/homoserine/homoserine lactone efflux protein